MLGLILAVSEEIAQAEAQLASAAAGHKIKWGVELGFGRVERRWNYTCR